MGYRIAFSLRGDLSKWLHYRGRFFLCQEKIGDLIGNYFGTTGSAPGANGGFMANPARFVVRKGVKKGWSSNWGG
jgi:hypothetical protein